MDHGLTQFEATPPYMQIASLGLVWMFFHCVPMCGPILSGLQLKTFSEFFTYQFGRALMYAIFGSIAGAMGASLTSVAWLGWIPAFLIFLLLLVEMFPKVQSYFQFAPQWLSRRVADQYRSVKWKRSFILGILFSLLPCSLVLWALTLSASTHSAFSGAITMVFFVGMSMIPLLLLQFGIRNVFRLNSKKVTIGLLIVSLSWTICVTLASQKIIPHFHFMFKLSERNYMLMFW